MRLMFKSPAGARICDWESYAVLRDNVQHFLENGVAGNRFPAIHSLEQAVDEGYQQVDAARLRGEVLRAWCALWPKTVAEAAISPRTWAILTNSSDLPATSRTVAARDAGWALPVEAGTEEPIPRAAGRFVNAILSMTSATVDGRPLRGAQDRRGARPCSTLTHSAERANVLPGRSWRF